METPDDVRVRLRSLEARDVGRITEACQDAECQRWLGQLPTPYAEADAWAYLVRSTQAEADGTVIWAIADPGSDLYLGSLTLFGLLPDGEPEIGYLLHPAARGRGVATEACRRVLAHALNPTAAGGLGLSEVKALAALENEASRRVLEHAGMTLRTDERDAVLVGGGTLTAAAVYSLRAPRGRRSAWPMGASPRRP